MHSVCAAALNFVVKEKTIEACWWQWPSALPPVLVPPLEKFAMNLLNRLSVRLPAILLVSVAALAGCAGMTHQEKGTATGAVIGGVAGNVLCGGILCTGAGAAVGGVIGHEVTK
jgi:osmotically inducible lipoprotein OsmB